MGRERFRQRGWHHCPPLDYWNHPSFFLPPGTPPYPLCCLSVCPGTLPVCPPASHSPHWPLLLFLAFLRLFTSLGCFPTFPSMHLSRAQSPCPATPWPSGSSLPSPGPGPPGHTSYPVPSCKQDPLTPWASWHPLSKHVQGDVPGPSGTGHMLGAAEKGNVCTQSHQERDVASCPSCPLRRGEGPAFLKSWGVLVIDPSRTSYQGCEHNTTREQHPRAQGREPLSWTTLCQVYQLGNKDDRAKPML